MELVDFESLNVVKLLCKIRVEEKAQCKVYEQVRKQFDAVRPRSDYTAQEISDTIILRSHLMKYNSRLPRSGGSGGVLIKRLAIKDLLQP